MAEWDEDWDQLSAAAVCRMLDCGSAVSAAIRDSPNSHVWWIKSSCVQSASTLSECVLLTADTMSGNRLQVTCSGNAFLALLHALILATCHLGTTGSSPAITSRSDAGC